MQKVRLAILLACVIIIAEEYFQARNIFGFAIQNKVVSPETEWCAAERDRISQRAQHWLDSKVPYNFSAFRDGYRTQCSGFVAFAWNLNVTNERDTPRCYNLESRNLAFVISQDDLRKGDAMVCNSKKNKPFRDQKKTKGQQGGGHCLIFDKWANENKTAFVGWELCKDATCQEMTKRVIPYPYFYKQACWEPMRRHDMASCII